MFRSPCNVAFDPKRTWARYLTAILCIAAEVNRYDCLSFASGKAMRRRDFITLLGSAAVIWPMSTRAQQRAIPVIGILGGPTASGREPLVAAFQQGLSEDAYT